MALKAMTIRFGDREEAAIREYSKQWELPCNQVVRAAVRDFLANYIPEDGNEEN